jgi:hypothetical protein
MPAVSSPCLPDAAGGPSQALEDAVCEKRWEISGQLPRHFVNDRGCLRDQVVDHRVNRLPVRRHDPVSPRQRLPMPPENRASASLHCGFERPLPSALEEIAAVQDNDLTDS